MLRKIIQDKVQRTKYKVEDFFLCILSAVLLIFSLPNFNIWLFAWFGFVPLFFAVEGKSKGKAFLLSYITGIIFWFGTIYWLIHVTLAGLILLVLYLALYFGVFGLIIARRTAHNAWPNLLFISSLWVILEYSRSHLFTGFPWLLLGYSQYLNLPAIQIADIVGAWGVSFLVMMVNIFVYRVMRYAFCAMRFAPCALHKKEERFFSIICCILVCLLFFSSLFYGFYKLRTTQSAQRTTLKISVIQGNIPQELKWRTDAKDFIMARYFTLTAEAVKDKPDLIIWPEASLPLVSEEEFQPYEMARSFVKQNRFPLLLGAVTLRDNLYYNSAVLISREGKLLGAYDKLHLVPFGEYIPLREILGFLETVVPIGDFTPGKEYTVFSLEDLLASYSVSQLASSNRQTGKWFDKLTTPRTIPSAVEGQANRQTKFSVLICFEDVFPQLARNFVKKGADFLVNITNDAWFGETSSPYQHLSASVFRAVENRVFLVRSANTGISGFIAPNGKIISLVQDKSGRNIFISGYKTEEINLPQRRLSFYVLYGDVFIVGCGLLFLLGCKITKRNLK